MRKSGFSLLGFVNIGLAVGLVFTSIWLYGREHDTRQVERQIRSMKRAIALEEETIRRLEIEWQRLRNPMRLERLAKLKLALHTPDPMAVMTQEHALDLLPLRPPSALEEEGASSGADGLDALAERAAAEQAAEDSREMQKIQHAHEPQGAAAQVADDPLPDVVPHAGAEKVATTPFADDPLARLIRNSTGDGQ